MGGGYPPYPPPLYPPLVATKFTETSLCFNSMIVASAAGGSSERAKDWQTEELRGREENWEETRKWQLRPISRTRVK